MTLRGCPGERGLREPFPEFVDCPSCGDEVEIWSDEVLSSCHGCGATVSREPGPTCLDWCDSARECVGDQAYERFQQSRSRD